MEDSTQDPDRTLPPPETVAPSADATVPPPDDGSTVVPAATGTRPGSATPGNSPATTSAGNPPPTEPPDPRRRRPIGAEPVPVPPLLLQRFDVERPLGMGGMAVVYLARDMRLGREIALKLIRAPSDELKRRFEVEGRLLAGLEHERVVRLYDLGFADGTPFMVMELVRGKTLAARLAEGRPTAVDTVRLLLDVLDGLGAAHARGIIHRDLKPGNVFLDQAGRAKVADFGLAREQDGEIPEELGRVLGTPGYLAPEQARGEHLETSADVYAVGVMLHEMLTGMRLFRGPSAMDVIRLQLMTTPAPPSSVNPAVPPALDELCMRALSAAPAARPTVAELGASLKAWLDRATGARGPVDGPLPAEPYKLLTPFAEADAPLYFGRDGEVRELADLLDSPTIRAVTVFGPCGIGKSSLLRAGLARGLDLRRRELAVLLAGADPERAIRCWVVERFGASARAAPENAMGPSSQARAPISTEDADVSPELVAGVLRAALRGGRPLVLVIDQLEELFTLNPRSSPRAARFFALVARLVDVRALDVRLVLSYRTEFRGDFFALDERLGHAHRAAPLREIAEAGLAEAIEGPSRLPGYGFSIADGFATRLAAEILASTRARGETALPVMQIVCRQLHDRMNTKGLGVIDAALYESALGGARGALERWVEDRLASPGYEGRAPMARQMLKALTLKEEGGERYARALSEDELLAFPDRDAARGTLERLLADHLVIRESAPDGALRVRLASEVVCPLVDTWALVPDAAERAARLLARAYRQWADQGRRPEDLLAGGALLAVLAQVPSLRDLSADERSFLALSRDRHRRRRAAGFTAGVLVAALAALVVWMAFLRPGRLELTSQPPGANVSLAGRALGATPLEQELPPGAHQLTFTHPRHRERTETVLVPVGGRVVHQANLLYPFGVLALSYAPAGAHWSVRSVDGAVFAEGDAPRQLELPVGRWRVRLEHPRHESYESEVSIGPNREATPFERRLASVAGALAISGGPPGTSVEVRDAAGRVAAAATLPLAAPLELDRGAHTLVASLPGHRTERRSVEITRAATSAVALRMMPVREVLRAPRAGFGPARATVVGDGLIVADDRHLVRHDAVVPRWTATLPAPASLAPLELSTQVAVPLADGTLAAYGIERGEPRWTGRLGEAPVAAVAVGPALVVASASRVVALGADGTPLWEHRWDGGHPLVGLAAAGDAAVLAWDDDGQERTLSTRDGHALSTARVRGGRAARRTHADLDGDGVLDPVACADGALVAVSGRTGRELFRASLPRATARPRVGRAHGQPVLCAVDESGALHAFDRDSRAASVADTAPKTRAPGPAGQAPFALLALADLDGDGDDDALVSGRGRLGAWTLTGRPLWSRPLDARREAWPAGDLDRDGAPDFALAGGAGRLHTNEGGRPGTLTAISGRSGATLWTQPAVQVDDLVLAPDLDGDGWRELAIFGTDLRAVSPRADAPRWTAELAGESRVPALALPGGTLALAVDDVGIALVDEDTGSVRTIAATGRAVASPAALASKTGPALVLATADGRVTALRDGGVLWVAPSAAAARALEPLGDVNGDGVEDLLVHRDDGRLGQDGEVLGGADGRALGEKRENLLIALDGTLICGPASGGLAVTSAAGKPLWTAGEHLFRERPLTFDDGHALAAACADGHLHAFARDGRPLWRADCGAPAGRVLDLGRRVVAITAREARAFGPGGEPLWRAPLPGPLPHACAAAAADLDGDGERDALLITGDRALALSGKSGRALWERPCAGAPEAVEAVGDRDGDGATDFLFGRLTRQADRHLTVLVSGRSGRAIGSIEGLVLTPWRAAPRLRGGREILARELGPGPRTLLTAQNLAR